MTTKIQRTLTQENLEESRKLRVLWDARTNRMPQAEFGEIFDVGSQAAVGQFLNGKAAISLKAAKGFAQGLSCEISAFSERLASEAAALGEVSGNVSPIDLTSLSRDELRMLLLFRQLETVKQRRLVELGAELLGSSTENAAEVKSFPGNGLFENQVAPPLGKSKPRISNREKQKA